MTAPGGRHPGDALRLSKGDGRVISQATPAEQPIC
jgi:hypothetical protein